MQMIDPGGPIAQGLMGIAATNDQVAGIEAEPDVGPREHFADLFWRFDVARAVMVKGRLVTAPAYPARCTASRTVMASGTSGSTPTVTSKAPNETGAPAMAIDAVRCAGLADTRRIDRPSTTGV